MWNRWSRSSECAQWRFAAGQLDQLSPLAMELIGLKVGLVVAAGGDVVAGSIIKASSLVPVVMTNAEDPVAAGFVVSLAHPGGNVTRLTTVTVSFDHERPSGRSCSCDAVGLRG